MYCALLGAHGSWWAPRTSNPLSGTRVSEVGSIPTRSRHLGSRVFRRRAGLPALLVLLWAIAVVGEAGVALAQSPSALEPSATEQSATEPSASESRAEERAESAEEQRSAAEADTTAWHRKPVATMFKSTLVPGWGQWSNGKHVKAGAFFLTEGYFFYRAARAAQKEWDLEDQGRDDEALSWNEERRDYTWWLLFVVILSMGDAYVDAHLRGFDAEFEPTETGGRAGFRWTF